MNLNRNRAVAGRSIPELPQVILTSAVDRAVSDGAGMGDGCRNGRSGHRDIGRVRRRGTARSGIRQLPTHRRAAAAVFFFFGRADDMFVCSGENIFPLEVEKMLDGTQQ